MKYKFENQEEKIIVHKKLILELDENDVRLLALMVGSSDRKNFAIDHAAKEYSDIIYKFNNPQKEQI